MNEFKIVLDENFGTYITIPETSRKVWLEVSDGLEYLNSQRIFQTVIKQKYINC